MEVVSIAKKKVSKKVLMSNEDFEVQERPGTIYVATCKYCNKKMASLYKSQIINLAIMHSLTHQKESKDVEERIL